MLPFLRQNDCPPMFSTDVDGNILVEMYLLK